MMYTRVRRRVSRLSSSRGSVFLRSLKLRRSKLRGLVGTDCRLLKLVDCLATKRPRIHT